jgi:hypothetical protein
MKTLITIIITLVMITGTAKAAKPGESIIISQSKNNSLFVFKAEKKFLGAMVEVYTSSGALLTSQNLQKRKMIIDFASASKDTYTIRVVKGSAHKEYKYIKK